MCFAARTEMYQILDERLEEKSAAHRGSKTESAASPQALSSVKKCSGYSIHKMVRSVLNAFNMMSLITLWVRCTPQCGFNPVSARILVKNN
jgi:hypothetical protein